mmetsp:Transcript_26903/g.41931  ORF Transcript_26903/g.41931 Transcript_26903/m.41931 type:complete len:250 (+) Transcript_26903:477-1226(+)
MTPVMIPLLLLLILLHLLSLPTTSNLLRGELLVRKMERKKKERKRKEMGKKKGKRKVEKKRREKGKRRKKKKKKRKKRKRGRKREKIQKEEKILLLLLMEKQQLKAKRKEGVGYKRELRRKKEEKHSILSKTIMLCSLLLKLSILIERVVLLVLSFGTVLVNTPGILTFCLIMKAWRTAVQSPSPSSEKMVNSSQKTLFLPVCLPVQTHYLLGRRMMDLSPVTQIDTLKKQTNLSNYLIILLLSFLIVY